MRCLICNKILTGFELSRKSTSTGTPLYICNADYGWIKSDVPTTVDHHQEHDGDEDYVEDDFDKRTSGVFQFYAVCGDADGD